MFYHSRIAPGRRYHVLEVIRAKTALRRSAIRALGGAADRLPEL